MKYRLIDKTTGIETLCDKVTIDGFDYYVSDEKIHFGYVWNTILEQIETMFKEKTFHDDLKGVIATNNPNTAIPKVVDEVEELADNYVKSQPIRNRSLSNDGWNATGFVNGYNKSQETHPFSEEDMIEFGNWLSQNYNISNGIGWWHSHESNEDISTKELHQLWKEQQFKIVYYEEIQTN